MSNSHPASHDQTAETLYWLDLAKNILGGGISPDEARHILQLGELQFESYDADTERFSPASAE